MAWLFVPGLADSSSGFDSSCLNTEPCVTWRGKASRPADWPKGRWKATWIRHLSGMICEPLTACRSVIEFISSLPASHVSPSPRPGRGRGSRTRAGCGPESSKLLATFDRRTSSWRTAPRSGNKASPSFSGTFPAQGSMRSGMCFRRKKRATRTDAADCTCLLPTPTEFGNNNRAGLTEKAGDGLATRVRRMLPTPTASEGFGRRRLDPEKKRTDGLETAVKKMLPTPLARDARTFSGSACLPREGTQPLSVMVGRLLPTPTTSMVTVADMEQARFAGGDPGRPTYREAKRRSALTGALNPAFVSWMMGLPIGWTRSEPLETQSFRKWLRAHGRNW